MDNMMDMRTEQFFKVFDNICQYHSCNDCYLKIACIEIAEAKKYYFEDKKKRDEAERLEKEQILAAINSIKKATKQWKNYCDGRDCDLCPITDDCTYARDTIMISLDGSPSDWVFDE